MPEEEEVSSDETSEGEGEEESPEMVVDKKDEESKEAPDDADK